MIRMIITNYYHQEKQHSCQRCIFIRRARRVFIALERTEKLNQYQSNKKKQNKITKQAKYNTDNNEIVLVRDKYF